MSTLEWGSDRDSRHKVGTLEFHFAEEETKTAKI